MQSKNLGSFFDLLYPAENQLWLSKLREYGLNEIMMKKDTRRFLNVLDYDDDYQEKKIKIRTEAFLKLIKTQFDPNEDNDECETILMYIVEIGRLDFVKFLVEAGANVNAISTDNREAFALRLAAGFGWQKIYDYLAPLTSPELRLKAEKSLIYGLGYQLRLQRKKNRPVDHLSIAAGNGDVEKIKELINNGVDVNIISSAGVSALYAACWFGQTSAVIALLSAGANPNIKSEGVLGITPLMGIIEALAMFSTYDNVGNRIPSQHKLEIAQILIEAGADVNAIDKNGNSVLTIAKSEIPISMSKSTKSTKIIKLLLEAGAKKYPNS